MNVRTKILMSYFGVLVATTPVISLSLPLNLMVSIRTTSGNLIFPYQQGMKVGGSAGALVDVWFEGNTYVAKNRSSRKVRVHLGNCCSALVNPGQTYAFRGIYGGGIQAFYGDLIANYED